MSINSSYLNPDSSGAPYGSNSANDSSDSYGAETYGAASTSDSYGAGTHGAASTSDSYHFSGGYSSYDEPASPLSSATGASATGASATSASSTGYNSTGAYSSTDTYESTGSSNSTKEDAVWRGQSSQEPAALKRPRVSTLIASLIMLAAAAILGALAMGVHFSWTAVGASTLGTIGLVLIASAFFANRNKSHT